MGILVVGSIAYDSVKTPFGETQESLGGSAVHFSAAASYFAKLNLIGVVGEDFQISELDFLKQRDVDFTGLQVQKGKTFRWKGRYGFDLNVAETLDTQLNVFGSFSPEIPANLRKPEFLFLGNIHPALQAKVLDQVERPKLVALDTMNFWIGGEKEALKRVIERVDLLVVNEGEARELTRETSLLKAARAVQSWGPKTVVIKQGEYGAVLFHGHQIFSAPGLPLETVKDPTGAGDSFAGGMMGFVARKGDVSWDILKQAVVVGSAMASLNVEEFSCGRLKGLKNGEIQERILQFKKLSQFEEVTL